MIRGLLVLWSVGLMLCWSDNGMYQTLSEWDVGIFSDWNPIGNCGYYSIPNGNCGYYSIPNGNCGYHSTHPNGIPMGLILFFL